MDPSSSSDEDEAVTVEQAEEDYDLRMFGISRALPVAEGTPDFDAGAGALLTKALPCHAMQLTPATPRHACK